MSIISYVPFQQAVYALLSADSALLALVKGIYDHAPPQPEFPYISIGDTSSKDWSSKTTKGNELLLGIHIFSREAGRKQSALIMERVATLLHNANLSVSGHHMVMLRYVSSGVELLADGLTYHATLRLRALLHEI